MYSGRLRTHKAGTSAADAASDSQATLTYSNSSANGGTTSSSSNEPKVAGSESNLATASGSAADATSGPPPVIGVASEQATASGRVSWLNKKEWESLSREARPHPYDMTAFQALLKEGDCTVFRRDQLAKLISTLKSFLTHRGKLKEGSSKVYGVKADLAAEVRRLVMLDDVISEKQAAKKSKPTTGADTTLDATAAAPLHVATTALVGAPETPLHSGEVQGEQNSAMSGLYKHLASQTPARCMLCSHEELVPGVRFCGLHHPSISSAVRVACTATNARGRQCSNFALSANTPKCYLHATEWKDRIAIAIEFKILPNPIDGPLVEAASSTSKEEVQVAHTAAAPSVPSASVTSTHTAADPLAALTDGRIPTLVPRATVPYRQRPPTLVSAEENKPDVTEPPPPLRPADPVSTSISQNLARLLTASVVGRGTKTDLADVAHGSIHSSEPALNTSRAHVDHPTASLAPPPARIPPVSSLTGGSSATSQSTSGTIFSKYESPLNPILTVIKRVLLRQGSTNASFEIPKEHQAAVSMRLNRILLIPMTNTSSPQSWPTSKELYVYLNGAGVTSAWRRNWPARKHSLSLGYLQLDITTQLSRAPTQRLQFDCFKNDYFATLHIVVAGARTEADVAKAQLRLSLENAQREAEIFRTYDLISGHGRCDDDEIETGEQTVALKCPVSQMQLNIPVRGASCVHLQCIDLEACLRLLHNGAYWNCPLCDQSMRFSEMRVDTVLFKAIEGRGQEGSLVSSTTAFVRLSDNHRSWQSDDRQRGTVGEAVDDEESAPSPPVARGQAAPTPSNRTAFDIRRPGFGPAAGAMSGSGRSQGNSPTSAPQNGAPPRWEANPNSNSNSSRKRVRDEGSRDEPIEID